MELGSEFNIQLEKLEYVKNTVFHMLKNYNTIYTNSGRTAIKIFNTTLNYDTVFLPEYICESVINCFKNKKVIFYKLDKDFLPILEELIPLLSSSSLLYITHYFGVESNRYTEVVESIRKKKKEKNFIVVEDTTHNFFNITQKVGDYFVCSLRKWFPIPDGAVLYTKKDITILKELQLPLDKNNNKIYAMVLKNLFINSGIDCNEEYRKIFKEAEERLDQQKECFSMSTMASFLLQCYNVEELKNKRKENYSYLYNHIKGLNIAMLGECKQGEYPFSLPVWIEDRDEFRSFLTERKIYCAVHWPIANTELENNCFAKEVSKHIISLPIDQRYNIADMDYLYKQIEEYFNG